jgi:D-xylulose kinase
MSRTLFLGIDNGTQGTKTIVFDSETASIIASASSNYEVIQNDSGRREQDPAWWIAAARETLSAVLASPGVDRSKIGAISVSGQQHGCTLLDADGNVLRPAKLWCDTETAPECVLIENALGGRAKVIELIGNSVAAGFTASKILWTKIHEPEIYAKVQHVLLPHDYLNYWLTGNFVTDQGDASGTAYFDVRARTWSQEVLKAIDPERDLLPLLPRVLQFDESAGTIRPEIASEFGLPGDVIVASGGGDNMMAAIGTGNVSGGVVTTSLGTSGTIFSFSESPVIDPNGELAAFCSSSGGWLPLICTMNVTVATEQVRKLFGLSVKEFDEAVARAPAGADGIILLPYFNGERTPPRPLSHASFAGISTTNFTKENLCRASMEGATLGLRYGIVLLEKFGVTPTQIRLVGGGAKSAIWRQIVADVFNCEVVCPACTEAGALGCAVQAIVAYKKANGDPVPIADVSAKYVSIDPTTVTKPSADAAIYPAVFDKYLALDRHEIQ